MLISAQEPANLILKVCAGHSRYPESPIFLDVGNLPSILVGILVSFGVYSLLKGCCVFWVRRAAHISLLIVLLSGLNIVARDARPGAQLQPQL